MEEHVYKVVKNAENNHVLRLNAIFNKEFIHLTILQNSNALDAMIVKSDIEKLSNGLNKTLEEYCSELKDYIANAPDNIKFSLKESEFIIYYLVENSIKIKYFSYKLNQINYTECVESLMDQFFREKIEWFSNYQRIFKEKNEIDKIRLRYEQKLQDFVDRKTSDDKDLLSNFMLLLNEKKRRIQHLNELLAAYKSNPTRTVNQTKSNKPSEVKKEHISDSESSEESEVNQSDDTYETDEDKNEELNGDPGPSTSKRAFDLFHIENSNPSFLPKRVKSTLEVSTVMIRDEDDKSTNVNDVKSSSPSNPVSNKSNVCMDTQDLFDLL